MTVLSIIPGIGTALVWVPAAIILAVGGSWVKAIVLVAWCGLIVGSVDNLLRPRLVGRDTQMHDLMILFSTLGGLVMFGVAGIIIGPIIAALFVTVWDIYGETFSDTAKLSARCCPRCTVGGREIRSRRIVVWRGMTVRRQMVARRGVM